MPRGLAPALSTPRWGPRPTTHIRPRLHWSLRRTLWPRTRRLSTGSGPTRSSTTTAPGSVPRSQHNDGTAGCSTSEAPITCRSSRPARGGPGGRSAATGPTGPHPVANPLQVPLLRRLEDPWPQPLYVLRNRAPHDRVPVQVVVSRSVHQFGVRLAASTSDANVRPLHILARPVGGTSATLTSPGTTRYPASCPQPIAEGGMTLSTVSCRLSAAGIGFLGHPVPAREIGVPEGQPTGRHSPEPERGYQVPHSRDPAGKGAA